MKTRRNTLWLGLAMTLLLAVSACSTPEPTAMPTAPAQPTETAQPTAAPTETASPDDGDETMDEDSAMSPSPTPETEEIPPTDTPEEDEMAMDMAGGWAADGVISDGEYTNQADFGDIRLWWHNDADYLYVAIEGDTTGWVSIGINPERGMAGANYLFGYVANGEAKLWDAYGTAPTGPNHPPDEELGGTDDIVTFAGTEAGAMTRFEVQIPLDSGDTYDQALIPGENYPVIIALGDADDYNAYHRRYDRGELTLAPSP